MVVISSEVVDGAKGEWREEKVNKKSMTVSCIGKDVNNAMMMKYKLITTVLKNNFQLTIRDVQTLSHSNTSSGYIA